MRDSNQNSRNYAQYNDIINMAANLERKTTDTPEKFAREIQLQKMKSEVQRKKELIAEYNRNPRSISDGELPEILAAANDRGMPTDMGRRKDTARTIEALTAIGVGFADSVLLGILKDEWYSNRRTKNHAKAGKIAGIIASLATPASWAAGAKAGGNVLMNALRLGGKYATLPGLVAGGKRLAGAYKLSKLGLTAAQAAGQSAKQVGSRIARDTAKALVSGKVQGLSGLMKADAFKALASSAGGAKTLAGKLAPYAGVAGGAVAGGRGLFELVKHLKESGVEDPYTKAYAMYKQQQKQMPEMRQRNS